MEYRAPPGLTCTPKAAASLGAFNRSETTTSPPAYLDRPVPTKLGGLKLSTNAKKDRNAVCSSPTRQPSKIWRWELVQAVGVPLAGRPGPRLAALPPRRLAPACLSLLPGRTRSRRARSAFPARHGPSGPRRPQAHPEHTAEYHGPGEIPVSRISPDSPLRESRTYLSGKHPPRCHRSCPPPSSSSHAASFLLHGRHRRGARGEWGPRVGKVAAAGWRASGWTVREGRSPPTGPPHKSGPVAG